jgi:hypothetical protein
MSVGQRSHMRFVPGGWRARVRAVASTVPEVRQHPPLPVDPATTAGDGSPSILGFPAEIGTAESDAVTRDTPDDGAEPVSLRRAASSGRLVMVRRADVAGGVLLVLAGLAAGLSLWFPWVRGDDFTGLSLVSGGLAVLSAGGPEVDTASWQPVAVVLGGGALLLLGLLLFLPAAGHRFVGLLAFVVAEVAAAGLLVPLSASGWSVAKFDVGMWCAVGVPVLGVVGALKAMLTGPRFRPEA